MREQLEARIANLIFLAGVLALVGATLIFLGFYLGFTGHVAYETLALLFFGSAVMLSAVCIDTGAENLKRQMERTK